MGEDVDDFVVRTKSKTDQIIRDYTAVASNQHKGISVLDDNGNLRDTYDILLDISKIYKEIQEEDKQYGTNRAQALVETLAGKNRSNIVASILQNGDILESVREASANDFMGSADEELGKYLDSIEGKVSQFKNRLQELASVSIDTTWIKNIVDFGSDALSVVTSLVKQFGSFNMLIGGGIGLLLQKSGKGLFSFDEVQQQWGTGIPSLFKGIVGGIKNFFSKNELSNELQDAFGQMDLSKPFYDQLLNSDIDSDQLYKYAEGLNEVQQKSITAGQAMQKFQKQTFNAGTVLSTVGNMALTAISTALTSLAVSAIIGLIGEAFKAIDEQIIHETDYLIKKGKEAQNEIDEINDDYKSKEKYTNENIDRYSELYEKNKKGNISTEEYEEYLQIGNQLGQLFPTLVSGFDLQGNAMLDLGDSAESAKDAISELLDQERQLADFKVSEQLQDVVDGMMAANGELEKDIDKQDKIITGTQEAADIVKQIALEEKDDKTIMKSFLSGDATDEAKKGVADFYDRLNDLFIQSGFSADDYLYEVIPDMQTLDMEYRITLPNGLTTEQKSQVQKLYDEFFPDGIENDYNVGQSLVDAMTLKNDDIKEIYANWNMALPSLLSSLTYYKGYRDLGENSVGKQLQNAVIDSINNIDYFSLSEDQKKRIDDDAKKFLREDYLDPITDTLLDNEGNVIQEKSDLFSQLLKFDGSEMTNEDYISQVNNIVSQITDDVELQKKIKVVLGFQYTDENGDNHWDITKERDELFEKLGGEITYDANGDKHHKQNKSKVSWSDFITLDQSDFEAFNYAMKNMNVDPTTIDSFKQLQEVIEKAKNSMQSTQEEIKDGTLSSIFNDEGYKTSAEGYEKRLTSLTGALEQIKTQGTLTAEAMRDLQEEFPDLTDFSQESIENATMDQLGTWISDIENRAKQLNFSPEGLEQLDTYIQNLVLSYGDLGVSAEEAKNAVVQSFIGDARTYGEVEARGKLGAQRYDEVIEQLKTKYGEDINYQIVWELAMEDRFSDPAADIVAEYQDLEMEWHVRVDLENEIADLQQQIESNNSKKSATEAANKYIQQAQDTTPFTDLAKNNSNKRSEDYFEAVREYGKDSKEAKIAKKYMDEAYAEMNDSVAGSFDTILEADKNNVESTKQIYFDRMEQYKKYGGNDETSEYYKNLKQSEADYYDSLTTLDQDTLSSLEYDVLDYTNQVGQYERDAADLQNEIDAATAKGLQPSQDVLKKLYDNYMDDAEIQDSLAEFWDGIANSDEYSQGVRATAQTNKTNAIKAAQDLREQAESALEQSNDYDLENYRRKGELLGMSTSDAEDIIEQQKKLGKRVSESMYDAAIKSAREEQDNYNNISRELLEKKQNFEDEWDSSDGDILLSEDYQQILKDIDANDSSLGAIIDKIRQLREEKDKLKMDDLVADFNGLQREATKLNYALEDSTKTADAGDYLKLIANNIEQQQNIQERIQELNGDKRSRMDVNTEGYQEWQNELSDLENQLHDTTQAQLEFLQSLVNMPVDNVLKAVQKYEEGLEDLQNKQELKQAQGQLLTHEDYQQNIDQQQQIVNKRKVADRMYSAIDWFWGNVVGAEEDSEIRQAVHEAQRSNQSSIISGMKNIFGWQKEDRELDANNLSKEAENLGREATRLKNEFDLLEAQGNKITEDSYKGLIDNNKQQIQKYQELSDEWLRLRNAEDVTPEDWITYDQNYTNARNTLADLQKQQIEYNDAVKNIPLNDLKNELSDIQSNASAVQDMINLNEAKGLKASVKDYEKLTKYSKDQIKNLRAQNSELRNQTVGLDRNGSRYREITQEILSNNSAIKQLESDIIGYESTGRRLMTNQVIDLSSAISSSLSEMTTKTGLSNDTIDSLMTGFSDIAGQDVSNLFYRTAEGVKVDIRELERLAKAENEIKGVQFTNEIEKQKQAIADYQNQIGQGNTDNKLKQMNSELQDLLRNQSEYYAQYVAQMEQISRLSQVGLADQTKNAGANWDQSASYIKEAKEMYDNGLIGTDDFKARAAYFDYWGFEDKTTFKENYDKIAKYYTEKGMDVQAFLNDLVSEGLGHWEGNAFAADFDSMQEAAQKFKGGIGEEWFTDTWGKIEDYGGFVAYIDSQDALIQKTNDLQQKISDSRIKLSDMILNGASDEDIQKQQDVVKQYEGFLEDINQAGENYTENVAETYKENFGNVKEAVSTLVDAYKDAELQGDERSMNRYMESIQDILDTYDLKLTADMEIDQDSYKQAEKEIYTVEDQLQQYSEGGNVDLTQRPQISTDKLKKAGYTDVGEGYATVFTHTFSNEDETLAMNFTPILPDGSVMEKDEFNQYCEDVIAGIREDTLGLKIGAEFTGENAIQQAEDAAEEIHELQEEYFPEKQIRTADTALSAADVGVGIERASEFSQVLQQIDNEAQNTDSDVSNLLDTLSQYSAEDLKSLNLNDGQYEGVFEGAQQAEQAMDSLVDKLGLTSQQAQLLAPALEALGYINPEVTVEADVSEVEEAETQVEQITQGMSEPVTKKLQLDEERGGFEAYDNQAERDQYEENKENLQPMIDAVSELSDSISTTASDISTVVSDGFTTLSSSLDNLPSGIAEAINEKKTNKELESGESTTNEPVSSETKSTKTFEPEIVQTQGDMFAPGLKKTPEQLIASAQGEQVEIEGVVKLGPLDTSEVENTQIPEKDVDVNFTPETSELDAAEQDAETPVEKPVNLVPGDSGTPDLNIDIPEGETVENNVVTNEETHHKEINEQENIEHQVVKVDVENGAALAKISETESRLKALDSMKPTPHVDLDNGTAISKIQSTISELNTLSSITATPSVSISGIADVATQINGIKSSLDSLPSTKVIHIVLQNEGEAKAAGYTGTMISPAHAFGTTDKNLDEIIKTTPITESLKFGNGDVGLPNNENALVNELGTESIIRDGRWFLIPGGMHVESLKKGDVILNHLQTKQLIASGRALGHGKAYAQGTVTNGMPAHADPDGAVISGVGKETGSGGSYSESSTPAYSADASAVENHTDAVTNDSNATTQNTGTTQENTKATEKSTQAYDWVERRLKYFSDAVEKITSQITDFVTYAFKKNQIKKQIKKLSEEVKVNVDAMSRYREKAKSITIDKDDPNNDARLKKLVREGNVESVKKAFEEWVTSDKNSKYGKKDGKGKTMSDRLNEYMEYWDKMVEANQNAINYNNDLISAYSDLVNIPLDQASDKIDKLSESISNLGAVSNAISTGQSGLRAMWKNGTVTRKRKTAGGKRVNKYYNGKGKKYRNTTGYVRAENEMLVSEYNQTRNEVKANRLSVKQEQKNVNSAQRELKKARKSINKKGLSKGQIKAIKLGRQIDVSSLSDDALKKALAYNRAVQKGKIAQDALKQAINNTVKAEAELAAKGVETAEKRFKNWKDYYDAYRDYSKSKASKTDANLSANYFAKDYLMPKEYEKQSGSNKTDIKYARNEANALRRSLSIAVKRGEIKNGSIEWKAQIAQINELEAEINQTRESQLQLFKDWVNAPIEKAAQAVEKLKTKFDGLNSVMKTLKSGLSAVAQYITNTTSQMGTSFKQLFSNNQKTYIDQNKVLDKQRSNQQSIVSANRAALATAQKNKKEADKELNSTTNKKSKQQKNINSVVKKSKLSSKQKNVINSYVKSGVKVNLDNINLNITDKKVLNAIKSYNTAVDARQDAATKVKLANNAIYEADKTLFDSEVGLAMMTVENEKEKFNNIKEYYDKRLEALKSLHTLEEKNYEKSTAHGNYATLEQYDNRISNKNSELAMMREERQELQNQLNKSVSSGIIKKDSDEWRELYNQIINFDAQIKDTEIEIENLTQEQIELKYDILFERAAKMADLFIDRLKTISGLINDDMMHDENGFLTAYGALAMQENATALDESIKNLKRFISERQQIIDDYNKKRFGPMEFNKKMEENQGQINKYLSDANSTRQTILNIIKNQSKAELDVINKNINAYKEMLNRKKEYYDYDKQLKEKTKNVQSLEKELAALEGVAGMEAAAQRARVKAKLDEANEDMEDTVRTHIYELQVQGLDDLMDQLQENYDDWVRELAQDLEKASQTIAEAIENTGDQKTIIDALNKILGQYGVTEKDLSNVKYTTHAKGIKRVNKKELALTNEAEYGRELIITKSGIITQLSPGDAVMPNRLTENFFAAAQNYPMIERTLNDLISGKGIGNVTMQPMVVQPNISCPITINGTNMSLAEVQGIINNFIPRISKTVQNDIRKDLRKNGR